MTAMIRLLTPFMLAGLLAGCATSDDPADGGFFSGVAGVAGGGFEGRVAEREAAVAAEQARQAALEAELAGLEREYRQLRLQLAQQRAALAADGTAIPASVDAEVSAVIDAQAPADADATARLAQLREAVRKARELSEALAAIG